MRWLITGSGGQLGRHLVGRLGVRGVPGGDDLIALTRADLDITDADAVGAAIAKHRPDVLVNAAAYTAVDAAESDENTAHAINALGPAVLAGALARHGGRMIQVSTDYVFGAAPIVPFRPYEPGDVAAPQSAYGRTKLAGERAVRAALPDRSVVVRTAWLHGGPGPNFVATMLRLARERPSVDVVDDQIGSPTWAGDLAGALIELGRVLHAGGRSAERVDAVGGVLHYANIGQVSWYQLACAIFRASGVDTQRVHAVTTAQFTRPAPRPRWSVLSLDSWVVHAGLSVPRTWDRGLDDSIAEQSTGARRH